MRSLLRKIEKSEKSTSVKNKRLKREANTNEKVLFEMETLFAIFLGVFLLIQMLAFDQNIRNPVIIISLLLIVMNILLICSRKLKKKLPVTLHFINQTIFVGFTLEFFLSEKITHSLAKPQGFLIGILLGLIPSLFMVARVNWKLVMFLFAEIFLFLGIRLKTISIDNFQEIALAFASSLLTSILLVFHLALHDWAENKKFHQHINCKKRLLEYKTLLKTHFPESILIFDRASINECNFLFINDKARKIFGEDNAESFEKVMNEILLSQSLESEELKGKSVVFLRESILEYMNGPSSSEDIISLRALGVYTSEASTTYFQIKLGVIKWDDNENAFLLILSDVSKEVKISELEMADINKDRVLASITHDLRTPIHSIISLLDTILSLVVDKKAVKLLNLAITSAKSLQYLVNDILDSYQISKGKLSLNMERFELVPLLQKIKALFSYQMKKKGIDFNIENNCGWKITIFADALRVEQILNNLSGNALKFTKKGFVKVSVAPFYNKARQSSNSDAILEPPEDPEDECLHTYDKTIKTTQGLLTKNKTSVEAGLNQLIDSINFIEITVEDTGSGIKEDHRSRLFKQFGKLPQEDETVNKNGIGLGLSISDRLAKLMSPIHADPGIKFESEYGKGTKFSFVLETWESRIKKFNWNSGDVRERLIGENINPVRSISKSFNQLSSSCLGTKNILIVDDDQFNILVLGSHLKRISGFSALSARSGAEALEKVEQYDVENLKLDLILIDINMPEIDGITTVTILSQRMNDKKIRKIPIVFMTALKTEDVVRRCVDAGGIDVMSKPITFSDLYLFLDKFFSNEINID